ncbi:MAG: hypothetical protein DCF15_15500 [Phormidesmis priestleyi]|uniref:Uncharacterized protein n=1 Tax=Phormidesmis priestleyi TaxID=268141 RepID=A0A2W4X017_9CYAN|nr:MAG: hypothetical protein DCF15_15500 [Phormidesmis priestleyi]
MGEAKRRKKLDSTWGKELRLSLEPADHSLVPSIDDNILEMFSFRGMPPNVQAVKLSSGDESELGYLLYHIAENDGTGVDGFTGRRHKEQFNIESRLLFVRKDNRPKWLDAALKPGKQGVAPANRAASDLAGKLARESLKKKRCRSDRL